MKDVASIVSLSVLDLEYPRLGSDPTAIPDLAAAFWIKRGFRQYDRSMLPRGELSHRLAFVAKCKDLRLTFGGLKPNEFCPRNRESARDGCNRLGCECGASTTALSLF